MFVLHIAPNRKCRDFKPETQGCKAPIYKQHLTCLARIDQPLPQHAWDQHQLGDQVAQFTCVDCKYRETHQTSALALKRRRTSRARSDAHSPGKPFDATRDSSIRMPSEHRRSFSTPIIQHTFDTLTLRAVGPSTEFPLICSPATQRLAQALYAGKHRLRVLFARQS